MFFLISRGQKFLKRFNTASCWDTFLVTLAICLSNFSLSIVTPRSMRSSLNGILLSQWNFGIESFFMFETSNAFLQGHPTTIFGRISVQKKI